MAERPEYAILGGGYWGGRMRAILAESRRLTQIEGARRKPAESDSAYQSRLSESFKKSGAQTAWLCVPPGEHILQITKAALEAGLHVIVEKPWLNSPAQTEPLRELAASRKLLVGIHYQYCLLDAVQIWKRTYNHGAGLDFGGCFTISRPDRIGIDAIHNLGSHLIALRNYSVPKANPCELRCGYQMADERRIWLEKEGKHVASIDFLANREPIIQRFIERVEAAINGAPFLFGLDFALRVAQASEELKREQRPSPPAPGIAGNR